jgi:hypothetical protein
MVDGHRATAEWPERALVAHPEVVRRAEMIVAMGDQFSTDDGASLQASLGGGPATLLTIVRAFSRVSSFDLGITGPAHSPTYQAPDGAQVAQPSRGAPQESHERQELTVD